MPRRCHGVWSRQAGHPRHSAFCYSSLADIFFHTSTVRRALAEPPLPPIPVVMTRFMTELVNHAAAYAAAAAASAAAAAAAAAAAVESKARIPRLPCNTVAFTLTWSDTRVRQRDTGLLIYTAQISDPSDPQTCFRCGMISMIWFGME